MFSLSISIYLTHPCCCCCCCYCKYICEPYFNIIIQTTCNFNFLSRLCVCVCMFITSDDSDEIEKKDLLGDLTLMYVYDNIPLYNIRAHIHIQYIERPRSMLCKYYKSAMTMIISYPFESLISKIEIEIGLKEEEKNGILISSAFIRLDKK